MKSGTPRSPSKPIFAAALRINNPDARQEYVQRACGDDLRLRHQVERLLAAHADKSNPLDRAVDRLAPAPSIAAAGPSPQADDVGVSPCQMIGHYKISELLAEGGMGAVYVAEQTTPVRRQVALKIIKPGMDSRQVIARFEAERQTLAMMDHPNIAKVLDGGTTTQGRPYFVMELVNGAPITEFCDREGLSTPARLRLFITVCRAVQHAHLKGIIHRDLKPSNVMVEGYDAEPVPKVIDFGVAKAIGQRSTEETVYTHCSQLVGTPLYMSPEQARLSPLDVDTRSDVYSLGVMLYELLTGTTPFDRDELGGAGMDEMRRIICEVDPLRPSHRLRTLSSEQASTASAGHKTAARRLSLLMERELDWIVMKALEKDRTRRYESASALADDLQRYLNDEPVRACPPSVSYRFRKSARRYKALLTTVVLVFLTAIAGTAVSVWYANQATVAANQAQTALAAAERRALEARQANERSQSLLYVADMKLASDAIARADAPRALELLQRHAPSIGATDQPGFEWRFFHKQVSPPQRMVLEQNAWVEDVELSPGGQWLATTAPDGDVHIHEMHRWTRRHSLPTDCESVNGLAWSPDSRLLAAACDDGKLRVWSFARGEPLLSIPAHQGEANDVVFSPDGHTLYSCGDDHLAKSWSVESGTAQHSFQGHEREVERIVLAPDGDLLATASSDGTFALWETKTAARRHLFHLAFPRMVCVAFSPSGRLVAAGNIDGHVYLADAQTGVTTQLAKLLDGVEALTFMEGGRRLATADRGGAIQLHPVPDSPKETTSGVGEQSPRWGAHSGRALALTVAGDGTQLISGGRDGAVRVWTPDLDATRWYLYHDPQQGVGAPKIAMGHENRLYVAGRNIAVWDIGRRRVIDSFGAADSLWATIVCSANGRYVAAARKGQLALFDVGSRQMVSEWPLDPQFEFFRLAISADGRLLAFTDYYGRQVVTVHERGSKQIRTFPAEQSECLAISPDSRWMAAAQMDDLRLFDLRQEAPPRDLKGHSSTLSDVAFSPDGELVATVSHDRLLKVWRVATGHQIYSIVAHGDDVESVAFTPDGRTIATAGHDQQVKLWHAATGQPLGALMVEAHGIVQIAFSSSGMHLAASKSGPIVIYDASDSSSFSPLEPAAEFLGVGDLSGGSYSSNADKISSNGQFIVGSSSRENHYEAFLWSRADGLHSMNEANADSLITGVSDDGHTMCGSAVGKGWNARVWTAPGAAAVIAPNWSHTEDLSSDGKLAVGWIWNQEHWNAFHWESGKLAHLGASPSHKHSEAVAITRSGHITLGRAFNTRSVTGKERLKESAGIADARPVLWTKQKGLELPPGFDAAYNWWAIDISDDGSVIVGIRWPNGEDVGKPTDHHSGTAFRWESGQVQLLGNLAQGGHSEAFAVSGDGQVVVGKSFLPTAEGKVEVEVGFIWDADNGMRSLAEVLAHAGASPAGWQLHFVRDVSADGTSFTGQGTNPRGHSEAYFARVPRQ